MLSSGNPVSAVYTVVLTVRLASRKVCTACTAQVYLKSRTEVGHLLGTYGSDRFQDWCTEVRTVVLALELSLARRPAPSDDGGKEPEHRSPLPIPSEATQEASAQLWDQPLGVEDNQQAVAHELLRRIIMILKPGVAHPSITGTRSVAAVLSRKAHDPEADTPGAVAPLIDRTGGDIELCICSITQSQQVAPDCLQTLAGLGRRRMLHGRNGAWTG